MFQVFLAWYSGQEDVVVSSETLQAKAKISGTARLSGSSRRSTTQVVATRN